jgi:hypothetical protein
MEIIAVLSLSITTGYIGFIFGSSMKQIEASEKSTTEAFKEGYIKGYFDGHARATKKEKPYYEDFPEMGIN